MTLKGGRRGGKSSKSDFLNSDLKTFGSSSIFESNGRIYKKHFANTFHESKP